MPQEAMLIYTAENICKAMAMSPGENLVWVSEDGMISKSGEMGFTRGFYKALAGEKILFKGMGNTNK